MSLPEYPISWKRQRPDGRKFYRRLKMQRKNWRSLLIFEDELKEKTERLNALNIELNLDQKDPAVLDAEPEETNELPERKAADRER